MLRLLPVLFLALLPAAAAAPVPRDTRPDFGANGLLTRADLEKVRFDSQPIKDRDGTVSEEQLSEDQLKRREAGGEEKPRPRNRFDVAVHMPWTKFREGEPIPAYFVMRNNRNAILGLYSRLDLSGRMPEIHGSAVSFDIRDRATGKSMPQLRSRSTNCGGGSLVDIPANGFSVIKADLSRIASAQLPAGDYEVEWEYFPLRSAPVRFTISMSDAPKPIAQKRFAYYFYSLSPGFEEEQRPEKVGDPFVWRDSHLNPKRTPAMTAALSVGQHGASVPDIGTIPAADRFVEARVEWKAYRDGDRVAVTLRAVPPHKQVRFKNLPDLYLQIESPDETGARWSSETHGDAKQSARYDEVLVTPLTIEAKLPADWRESVVATGTARVAVLVVSERLEMPFGPGARCERMEKFRDREVLPRWSGLVRTEFVELRFPMRMPRAEK